ncbi:NTF2 fold immunity protein, partial [Flavonifractor plautii]
MNLIERLAGYTLVGFHVKDYPVSDELLAAFAGHKSMVNFGVENAALTDACFPIFSAMPKLRYLLLDGNAAIHGSGLSALQNCKLDLLTLNRTGLDDGGLLQAAAIPKLSHIQIDHTAITYDGLLAVAGNSRIEPVAHEQFTKAQMEHFFHIQREKAKKPTVLDEQAAEECRRVLSAFFAEMTEWEQYMEQAGFEDSEAAPRLLAIWERYVSEKPRPGYRPLALSYSAQGTYNGERFLDAEQLTRNKLCIYTREKNTGFDRRFLMKRVDGSWKIDAVQERLDGWQRVGL